MTSAPCRVKRVSEQFKRRKARNEAKELAVIQAAEREEEERVNKVRVGMQCMASQSGSEIDELGWESRLSFWQLRRWVGACVGLVFLPCIYRFLLCVYRNPTGKGPGVGRAARGGRVYRGTGNDSVWRVSSNGTLRS